MTNTTHGTAKCRHCGREMLFRIDQARHPRVLIFSPKTNPHRIIESCACGRSVPECLASVEIDEPAMQEAR